MRIDIAAEFTDTPGGRFTTDGPWSGERFRTDFLIPALQRESKVVVALDGAEGFGSSFLEEAFGGLVRHRIFSKGDLKSKLDFETEDESLRQEIWEYIETAIPGAPADDL